MLWCIIICYFILMYSDATALSTKFMSLRDEFDKRSGGK